MRKRKRQTVSEAIRSAFIDSGWRIDELVAASGVSYPTVWRWQAGRGGATQASQDKIAEALGCRIVVDE